MTHHGLLASRWHAGWPWDEVVDTISQTCGHAASMRQREHDWPASHDEIGGADGGVDGGGVIGGAGGGVAGGVAGGCGGGGDAGGALGGEAASCVYAR